MSFFTSLLEKHQLKRFDGRALWKFSLSDNDFNELKRTLESATHTIDTRDAALYYAEWWKRAYNGGTPKKEDVWNSFSHLPDCKFDSGTFFLLAKRGGSRLGYHWIKKQNTLFFRTLLLQGGLPLLHITNNQGNYQNFLLAVLDEQPQSIEDFKFREDIVRHLPVSSRNDTIYENCFEIVKSILNDESIYDDLLSSNEAIKGISNALRVHKKQLKRKERISKPQNYWLLSLQNNNSAKITLRLGLADTYDKVSLENILGFEVVLDSYPLYVEDRLICTFKKMLSGLYKTVWNNQDELFWSKDDAFPYVYSFYEGVKTEITDFIHSLPVLDEATLWAKYSDTEWRLLRGNQSSINNLALLMPFDWKCANNNETKWLIVDNEKLSWIEFEGEIEVVDIVGNLIKYQSNVQSFDWVINSKKPDWLLKHNIPVVVDRLNIHLYNDLDEKVHPDNFKVWIKQQKLYDGDWQRVPRILPKGYIDVKIEYRGVVAYDKCFNIGNLKLEFSDQKIDFAKIRVNNLNGFNITLNESPLYTIEKDEDFFTVKLNVDSQIIPNSINGTVGYLNQKKLIFQAKSPFSGTIITDHEGKIIPTDQPIYLKKLHGMRILSTESLDKFVRVYNSLRENVKIIKELKDSVIPVIQFKEELERVYYLSDVMNYRNSVTLEIQNGNESVRYKVLEYTHTLDIEKAMEEGCVSTFEGNGDFDMFAVPLNCKSYQIDLFPLQKQDDSYILPEDSEMKQFIIISSPENDKKLMPRFVNVDESHETIEKTTRINQYHQELNEAYFKEEIWKQVLTYFDICIKQDIPFSTFDQIRAISRSSRQASRAFFYLGIHQTDQERYLQFIVPKLEQELGFNFHWVAKEDWFNALREVDELYDGRFFNDLFGMLNSFFRNLKMDFLLEFINGMQLGKSEVYNSQINDMRAMLGSRVLHELPKGSPRITHDYGFPINMHRVVKLLIKSPIAVAEAICNVNGAETNLWKYDEDSERRKRNIQYSRELTPTFYNEMLKSCLSKIQ